VYFVGFQPGFAYLGDLDERLRLPRRDTPRAAVPAGSVAIALHHTAVYPSASPGGWHIIGRTDVGVFDAQSGKALFAPGDRVRFKAV
jgi:KipI family sensor histidine kinase inhibitor